MSINVTLLDNAEPKLEVSEVPEVPITLEPEVPEVEDKNILNLLELEEVDLTPPLSETCDLREENKLLTTIVDISSSTEPHEEKEEDLGLDIPEFNFEETINLDDLTVANDDEEEKEEENDELEVDFSLDLDVNDAALFKDVNEENEENEENEYDFTPYTNPLFVFTPRTETELEPEVE